MTMKPETGKPKTENRKTGFRKTGKTGNREIEKLENELFDLLLIIHECLGQQNNF